MRLKPCCNPNALKFLPGIYSLCCFIPRRPVLGLPTDVYLTPFSSEIEKKHCICAEEKDLRTMTHFTLKKKINGNDAGGREVLVILGDPLALNILVQPWFE